MATSIFSAKSSTSSRTQHLSLAERSRRLKVTVVGDGNVGKTCLLMSYTANDFPGEYLPTVFDTHTTQISVEGVEYQATLWDTAGQEEYAKLRPLSYPKTDCFIVCYAVDNPTSFLNVKSLWIPEVRKYCPKAAVLLVGTKSDLSSKQVTAQEAKRLRSKIDAQANLECSALTRDNLDNVFVEAILAVLKRRGRKSFPNCRCS